MPALPAGRATTLACLVLLPLGACVSQQAESSAGRASALATTLSRATACRAGSVQRGTFDRFLAAEKQRGANDEQLAAARSAYVSVSEAETVNQSVRPQRCTAEERAELKARMTTIGNGTFDAP